MSSWRTLARSGSPMARWLICASRPEFELLGHVRVLPERLHLRPERLLLLADRGVVPLELRATLAKGADDALDVALRFLVLGEVGAHPVAEGNDSEELSGTALGQIVLCRVQLLDRAAKIEQALGDGCIALTETPHRPGRAVEQAVAHVGGRSDLAVGEAVDVVDAPAVVVAMDVDRAETTDEGGHHGVDSFGGFRVDGHLALGLGRPHSRGCLRRREGELGKVCRH